MAFRIYIVRVTVLHLMSVRHAPRDASREWICADNDKWIFEMLVGRMRTLEVANSRARKTTAWVAMDMWVMACAKGRCKNVLIRNDLVRVNVCQFETHFGMSCPAHSIMLMHKSKDSKAWMRLFHVSI